MASSRFVKTAKEIAQRDKAIFDSLIDFEKTGKMQSKSRLNFTIDKAIADRFRRYCKSKGLSMSAKIEQAMRDILKDG